MSALPRARRLAFLTSIVLALTAAPHPPLRAASPLFDRTAIVGASLSAGFQAPPGWEGALRAGLHQPPSLLTNTADSLFFLHPGRNGRSQIDAVSRVQPTVLVALDFPFWFGYGKLGFDRTPLPNEAARLDLLRRGLQLLDTLPCPIVLGDFPDMSAAVGQILSAAQMPKAETLDLLNRELHAWAVSRTNVLILPLADWVRRLQSKETIAFGRHQFPPELTRNWLQPDQLHPTPRGLTGLALLLRHHLVEKQWLPADAFLDEPATLYRHMGQLLREDEERQIQAFLSEMRQRASQHPDGSPQQLQIFETGFRSLYQRFPQNPGFAIKLIELAERLPADRARALAQLLLAPPAPEEVRTRAQALLDSPPAP